MKNQYIGGDCLKRGGGGLEQFVDLGGLGKKEGGGGVFEGGVDTPMPTMVKISRKWWMCSEQRI